MNKPFIKTLMSLLIVFFLIIAFLAFQKTSLILFFLCTLGIILAILTWVSYKKEELSEDLYHKALKAQQEERTKKFIAQARRKQFKLCKGGKNETFKSKIKKNRKFTRKP